MRIAFYEVVGALKTLPRTGWKKRAIPGGETVDQHMYRSQYVAYDLAKKLGEDPVACAHMMMIHDLPEADPRVGDLTPGCGVSKQDKAALELQAARDMAELSGNPEFLALFEEYEAKQTPRAKICNDADQLECLVQCLEYAQLYPEKREELEDFWPYAQAKLLTEPGKEMFQELWQRKLALAPYEPLPDFQI